MIPSRNSKPVLRHIANLWTLVWHPTKKREWSLERKLRAVKAAGFDGFTTQLTPVHKKLADELGLMRVGYFSSGNPPEFASLLRQRNAAGAYHINVQLADHDTPINLAIRLTKRLMLEAKKLAVEAAVEVHRDTCTETPEKTYALADGYQKATGTLLPMTWDIRNLAIVKHLLPPYWERLGGRSDLIRRTQQFSFPPLQRSSLPGAGHQWAWQINAGSFGLSALRRVDDGDLARRRAAWEGNVCCAGDGAAVARLQFALPSQQLGRC